MSTADPSSSGLTAETEQLIQNQLIDRDVMELIRLIKRIPLLKRSVWTERRCGSAPENLGHNEADWRMLITKLTSSVGTRGMLVTLRAPVQRRIDIFHRVFTWV